MKKAYLKYFLLIILLANTFIFPSMAQDSEEIKDVKEDSLYYKNVDLIVNKYKIMSVYNNNFMGNNNIDRYSYSIILVNTIDVINKKMKEISHDDVMNLQIVKNIGQIPDLKKEHWAYEKVMILLKLGLIRTFNDNKFRGEKNVDFIGFSIGLGRLLNIIYDSSPDVLKQKWKKEAKFDISNLKSITTDSSVYKPLKLSMELGLLELKDNNLEKPITRYEATNSIIKLMDKIEEFRKYSVFYKVG